MFKRCLTATTLVALLAWTASAQDAKTTIANASKAMGYDQLRSIEYSGSGTEGTAMGQAQSATAGWPHFTLRTYTRYIDINAGTGLQNSMRSRPADPATGQLPGGGGLAPQAEAPNTTNIAANANWTQKLDVALSPPGFLKMAAAASNPTQSSRSMNGKKYTVISFPVDAKSPSGAAYTLTGYINDQNMVEKVETALEDNLIGDMVVEQSYSGYKDFGSVKFPTHIVQKRAGLNWTDLTVADVKTNGPAPAAAAGGRGGAGGGAGAGAAAGGGRGGDGRGGDGRGAQAAGGGRGGDGRGGDGRGAAAQAGRGAPGAEGGGGRGGAQAAVGSKKLGDGIYMITGGYRSVAVEFKNHILLIEAPQNEMTTMNIIAEAKRVIPNKPIKYVVNTHSHSDHSGGLRAAVAEGATIVTYQSNKALYEKWFSNPRTLVVADKLSQLKTKPKFQYIGEKKVFKEGSQVVELYHLKGALHAEDSIVAYLPSVKTIIEADAFNPPAPNAAPPANINGFEKLLASEMDRLKVDYTTIISVHQPGGGDRDVTKADLLRNIGKGN